MTINESAPSRVPKTEASRRLVGWLLIALAVPLLAVCLLGLALGDTGPARSHAETILDRSLLAASFSMFLGGLLVLLRQRR